MTLMLFQNIPPAAATIMVAAAISLTFIAFVTYLRGYIILMRNRDRENTGDSEC